MKKVLVIDTNILCVWLEVPCMDSCGPQNDVWDKSRIGGKIEEESQGGTTFVLPLATVIETGNHVAQANHSRKERAEELASLMRKSAEQETPWAAFSDQSVLWTPEKLKVLADDWPALAAGTFSLGDATIKDVAEHYAQTGFSVEILTGDKGLKAYEPAHPPVIPRRRQTR